MSGNHISAGTNQQANLSRSEFLAPPSAPPSSPTWPILAELLEAAPAGLPRGADPESAESLASQVEQIAASSCPQGVTPCNTTPSKRQPPPNNPNPSERETGGPDTLIWHEFGFWRLEAWCNLLPVLVAAKEAGKLAKGHQLCKLPNGGEALVWYHGINRGQPVTWVVQVDGIFFYLVNRQGPSERFWSVGVEVGSLTCMEIGTIAGVYKHVGDMLESLGWRRSRSTVNRCDLTVDMPGWATDPITRDVNDDKYVGLGRKFDPHRDGRKWTGFTLGTDVMLKVYDKRYELLGHGKDGKNARKWDHIANHRGCAGHEQVTRVEWQVRGESLKKDFGVSSMEDLIEQQGRMVKRLNREWFRHLDSAPDRKNHNVARVAISDFWAEVELAYQQAFGEPQGEEPKPRRRGVGRPGELFRQAFGAISSALARSGVFVTDPMGLLYACISMAPEAVQDAVANVAEKMDRIAAEQGNFGRQYDIQAPNGFRGELAAGGVF